ncbi:MAG: 50S ribosomal protein L23 [Polyangiales bacterium]
MSSIPNILRRPLVLTEKGTNLKEELNQVLFEVSREATKHQIRAAVEAAFNVKVTNVRTMVVRGKMKRMGRGYAKTQNWKYAKTQNWKKAIVTLRDGDKIAAFEAS